MSQAAFFHAWGETMAWLLRGWSPEEAQALFEQLTEAQILPNLRPDVLQHLRQHQSAGHLVALVSGTFAPLLETIARHIGVAHAIGTRLEMQNGQLTGRIVPPLCQGEGKPRRVQSYLSDQEFEVDWEASFAYADRDTDLPLLALVRHPVAVYPDEALLAHARAQDWTVIGETEE
jgi:HAD superfamily hydrolase (TIGR01490 family)